MGRTQIRGGQVLDGSIKRKDLNIDNADNAVIRKIIAGTGISISSTGAATGTGDVTVNATGGGSGGSNVEIAGEKLLAFSVETTDATESTLAEVEITDDTTTTFIAWIAARGPSNKNYWCQISGGVRRNTSASAVLIGTPIITDDDENSSGYVADVDVDGNNLRIRVTGAASETVIWQGKILQTNAVDEEQYLTSSGVLGFTAVTEDATETALATLKVPDNKNVSFQILVSSHLDDTATNKNYWCQILGSVRRNNGGDAVLVDDPILSQGDEGTPGYSCEVAVSGQNLVLNVTGATSETVNWRAKFIIVEDREPLNVIELVGGAIPSFPDWDGVDAFDFEKVQDALVSRARTNIFKANYDNITQFGSLGAGSKWYSGINAPNGCIYGIPQSATTILKIDTSNDSVTTFGSLAGSDKYAGGVLAPNGCIYGIPNSSTSVLKIDTSDDTITSFGSVSASTWKWCGGVLAPNGKIYCVPFNESTVLKIDPDTDTVSTFGSVGTGPKWTGGVLAPNGYIYCVPHSSTCVLKINPSDDSVSVFGSLSGNFKWVGGALAPNGCIYCFPHAGTTILRINTENDTVTTFGSVPTGYYISGNLGPDGRLYSFGGSAASILIIDPVNNLIHIPPGWTGYAGAALGPNGSMYGIPNAATAVAKINLKVGIIPDDFCLSSYFNKF